MTLRLTLCEERWPIAGAFRIARGAKTEAATLVVEVTDGVHRGRGEAVPYARYGEALDTAAAAIRAVQDRIETEADRASLQALLPPGAARNAVDCALWDLEAKRAGRPAWALAGLGEPRPVTTCFTISLDTPEAMAAAAAAVPDRPLLKLKLGAEGDVARVAAVRAARPEATLVADANEGWSPADLAANGPALAALGVAMIEQPLPATDDAPLEALPRAVPLCADESFRGRSSLAALRRRYDAVNVKLDKAGGLTEALAEVEAARALGLEVMVGCMVATSLAMAPAFLLTARAAIVDLDGPLLLSHDRAPGIRYDGATMFPPSPELWG